MDLGSRVGSVLQGRYKILQFLGRGGMGAVFQCEDMRLPGKVWAVKEMLVYDPSEAGQVEESFKREAAMLARLRHRNLPIIVDYFIESSRQYLVMEFIEGETLARYIQREGPVGETQGLRWALELAQVLEYLHRQEKPVIFRDLKPENVLVSADLHMKLVDFGLARQFDPAKLRDTQASGSVGYAPPEQWEDANQTDERSDIYSLGATLYYALTGRPPSPIYGSHRLRPHRPDIEAGTEAVVLRCLQPDPSNRYSGTDELIRDLLLLLSRDRHQKDAPRPAPLGARGTPPLATPSPLTLVREAQAEPAVPVRPSGPGESPVSSTWVRPLLALATVVWLAGVSLAWVGGPRAGPVLPSPQPVPEKEQARSALQHGDYAAAITLLDRLVTRAPEDAEAHILQANAYVLLQKKAAYRIPVITSLTGSDDEGYQILAGLALAQMELNQAGGVVPPAPSPGEGTPSAEPGRMILLEVFDDETKLDRGLELATTVGRNPDYAICVGPYSSQQAVAVAPTFEAAHMPDIAPAASDPRVWKCGRYLFSAADADDRRVQILAQHFAAAGLTQGAVFSDESSLVSRSMADIFNREFTRLGGKVVLNADYDVSRLDFSSPLKELARSSAQFVFLSEYRAPITARFAHDLRGSGLQLPLAAETAAFSDKLLGLGGKDLEGLWMSTYFHPDAPSQEIQEFTRHFSQAFGKARPCHREANAYDSLLLIAKGIHEVGFDREALRDWLASLGDSRPAYPGVTGKFAPAHPLAQREPYLVQLREGIYSLRLPDGPNPSSSHAGP